LGEVLERRTGCRGLYSVWYIRQNDVNSSGRPWGDRIAFTGSEDATMADMVPMTRAGYEKLRAEIEHLDGVEMPKLAARVAAARSEGDLSENAEYHGARESQGLLQAKINMLRDKLSRAQLMDTSNLPKDEVVFGATVIVKDLDFGDTECFTLVGAGEEDYDAGRILVTSPLAQGLVGRKVGEKVTIEVPAGTMHFEILEIKFEG
jgi:transcription elongation factor GreA